MTLSVFLFGMLSICTYATLIKHKLPLNDCRTGEIDLLLVSDFSNDTALQIRRFKNIVQWFFPASSNDPMRLRLHLLVHVNETHFESLIHFDDYNTTDGLTEGLNRLVENRHFKRSDELTCSHACLQNAEEIFDTSQRIKAKRLAIFVNYCNCPLTIRDVLSHGTYYQFILIFGRNCFFREQVTVQNVQYLSETDDLTNDHTVKGTLCNPCLNGWLPLMKKTPGSNLSCFFIKELDRSASRKNASSFCDSMKAKLVTFETKEEFNFLQTHLEGMAGNHTEYFVYLGLAQRRYQNVYGFHWDNNLPLTFNFPMVVINVKSTSFLKHVVWISPDRSRDGNATCDSVTDIQVRDEKKTQLVICEQEEIYPPETKVEIKKSTNVQFFIVHYQYLFYCIEFICKLSLASILNQKKEELTEAGKKCIVFPLYIICDGYKDCFSYEDEKMCIGFSEASISSAQKQPCNLRRGHSTGRFFSDHQRCDGHPDCPRGEDEEGCDDVCLETLCDDGTCLPSQWFSNSSRACSFVMSVKGVLPADVNITHENNCSEVCGNGPCVYPKELAQGIVFCDDLHINEISCRNVLENRTWTARCVYLKGRFNSKLGCSDLSHLDNCNTFNCPEGLYKCPSSYCIPLYNINDGYPDCPYGEDEYINLASENLFKCYVLIKKPVYLLPIHVCDNKTHCPRGDDELGCYVTCPAGLKCVLGAISPAIHPEQINLISLSTLDIHARFLNMSGIDLSHVSPASRGNLNKLVELHASNCNLSSAENIFFDPELEIQVYLIDLSYNNICEINSESIFYLTTNLKILNLSHNLALHTLDIVYSVAMKINSLDLSFTNISTFNFQSKSLQFLNLSHTRLRDGNIDSIRLNTFDVRSTELKINQETSKYLSKLSVTSAFFGDNFFMCCPQIRGPGIAGDFCFAPQDPISSCEDLLGDQVKRILLWILAVVSVGGNLMVIGFRLVFERKLITKSYRLFITNLSISDLIMGVYLFIIAGNDVYYRENYVMFESEWRHSSLCTVAGFLATLSCETSALFVLLVTLERYLVIRFPLGTYRIKRVKKYFLLLVSWVVGVVLAVAPLVYPDWAVYSSNGTCLGLPMIRNQDSGLAYSFGVFLMFNCVLFVLMAMGQLAIFQAMSREKTQLHTSAHSLDKRSREIMVAKNLSLVVMSNFLCWFPICVIGLMTARGHTFSQQTYGWLAVFVMPLNSAVNPVIYTLPVVYKKWEDFKNGQTRKTPTTNLTAT